MKGVSEEAKKRYLRGDRTEEAYGTTLLAVCVTNNYWFGIHQGDGKCVCIDRDGKCREPIPWDERCFLNMTTSLCDKDAIDRFRYYFSTELPAAVFVGTDGVDDSYSGEDLHALYRETCSAFYENGFDGGVQEIEVSLPIITEKASKDDISIAGIIDMEYLPTLISILFPDRYKAHEEMAATAQKDKTAKTAETTETAETAETEETAGSADKESPTEAAVEGETQIEAEEDAESEAESASEEEAAEVEEAQSNVIAEVEADGESDDDAAGLDVADSEDNVESQDDVPESEEDAEAEDDAPESEDDGEAEDDAESEDDAPESEDDAPESEDDTPESEDYAESGDGDESHDAEIQMGRLKEDFACSKAEDERYIELAEEDLSDKEHPLKMFIYKLLPKIKGMFLKKNARAR
jgi:hypothetical protein